MMRKYLLNEKGVRELHKALPKHAQLVGQWQITQNSTNIILHNAWKTFKVNGEVDGLAYFTVSVNKFRPTNEWASTFKIEYGDSYSRKLFLDHSLHYVIEQVIFPSLHSYFGDYRDEQAIKVD